MEQRGGDAGKAPGAASQGGSAPPEHFGLGYVPWYAPQRTAPAGMAHTWVRRIRATALGSFSGVRYAGAVLALLFSGLVALINYHNCEPPVPLPAWAWDLAGGVGIALLWLWGGWRPLLWWRERCRAHTRRVLEETAVLALVLSLEPSAGQPALWRLVLGSAANYHPGKPHSFQRRIRAFIRHFPKFMHLANRAPLPPTLVWVELGFQLLGGTALMLGLGGLWWCGCEWPLISDAELPVRAYFVISSVAVSGFLLLHTLVELRRAAIELAVADVLLGEEV